MSTNLQTPTNETTTSHLDMEALNKVARIAGVLYLIIIFCGMFAQAFVRDTVIEAGDAAATAENIVESELLFRLSIAADLIMIMSDVAIGLAFYFLLRPVNQALSLLSALFRLAQAATLGINLLMLFFVLQLLSGADYLAVFGTEQLNAQALMFLEAHSIGYKLALVFFAFSILIQGYLMYKSGYFPKIIAALVIAASMGYFVDNFATFILLDYEEHASIFETIGMVSPLLGEVVLCVWLLVRGVRMQPSNTEGNKPVRYAEALPS